ncbi:Glycosyl transferase, group 1 [Mycetocola reblochoni REB411]|uniref:Glycosyl transferase, group 1 n=1 Tax=Mycetocola reblochoni REB411 TaxID=1255698 RepID=A0A1R4K0E2_9MICO|nr:Glycosyl transferase, group 1 [Mycetocola reblochoni REB411]
MLRLVLDRLTVEQPTSVSRYAEELARALIATAPRNCVVEGIVSASGSAGAAAIAERLPGLADLHVSPLPHRELRTAWQLGLATGIAPGMLHAPDLLAPLRKHDRRYESAQSVVTVHNTLAWTHPKSLHSSEVAWQKAMLRRARKFADAVIVPSHAVAAQLTEIVALGDRVRVIEHGVSPQLTLPVDAEWRAQRLELPEHYLLAQGDLDPRRGLTELVAALAEPALADARLLIVGGEPWGEVSVAAVLASSGVDPDRVRALGRVSNADLAVLYDRADAFVLPSRAVGFGLPALEAFSFGTPVVISDDASLREVAGDSAEVVPLDGEGFSVRLAATIAALVSDEERRAELAVIGQDRARAYSWASTGEQIWQLHADL